MRWCLTVWRAAVTTAATIALSSAQAAAAKPPLVSVTCGQTLTHSIRLANDLTNCAGDGLIVGADGVTVDLNGHAIDGDGMPGATGPDVGILDTGRNGVTIKGGTVREFDRGVRLDGASGNRLRDLSVLATGRGIELVGSSGNRIERNTASGNPRSAIALVSSDDNVVDDNAASGNHVGVFMSGSAGNRVDGNAISNSEFAGIETDGIEATTISGNRVVHDQSGIILVGDGNTVVRNRIDDAFACDGCGYGISMEGGSHNLVARNVVTRSSHIGIRLDAFAPPATANVIRDNLVLVTGDDGIAINPEDVGPVTETVLDANTAIGSGDDGIDVDTPTATLTSNRALHNGDLGIEAVAGVTDGGGNVAAGNANPAQCTNVLCR